MSEHGEILQFACERHWTWYAEALSPVASLLCCAQEVCTES